MQPHSMCAVALAGYVWNKWEIKEQARVSENPVKLIDCDMRIEYRLPEGEFRNMGYKLTNIVLKKNTIISFDVAKSHGSLHCSITVEGTSEGSEINIYHSEHHATGLREKFNIYSKRVDGHHENSLKYGKFDGDFGSFFDTLTLYCEILRGRGTSHPFFVKSTYTLNISSLPELVKKS